MKYIIMCGGDYKGWEYPRQISIVNGEPLIARTIRLLKSCGVMDIAISASNPVFEEFGVPVLYHNNHWEVFGYNDSRGAWVNGFYPTNDPVCYIFGDVVFSEAAIIKIVNKKTYDIEFFASAPPFSENYPKEYAEPFAFKVFNTAHFWRCVEKFKQYKADGKFDRDPMAWELWQLIKNTPINKIYYDNYTVINDYTCDIDDPKDVKKIEQMIRYKIK